MKKTGNNTIVIIGAIIVALLLLICYLGFSSYFKKPASDAKTNINNNYEVMAGENAKLSKVINDYIASLNNSSLMKNYNIVRVAHVFPWNDPDDKNFEIQFKYYYNNVDLGITDYSAESFSESEILNISNNLKDYLAKEMLTVTKFNDVSNNGSYFYLVELKVNGTGDAYTNTKHYIYSTAFNKLYTIPELESSHIWYKNGNSILSSKTITAELNNNKIYSLTHNDGKYYEYESYIENGKFVSNNIKTFNTNDLEISGEKS